MDSITAQVVFWSLVALAFLAIILIWWVRED